jgi:hypothetical protein
MKINEGKVGHKVGAEEDSLKTKTRIGRTRKV